MCSYDGPIVIGSLYRSCLIASAVKKGFGEFSHLCISLSFFDLEEFRENTTLWGEAIISAESGQSDSTLRMCRRSASQNGESRRRSKCKNALKQVK